MRNLRLVLTILLGLPSACATPLAPPGSVYLSRRDLTSLFHHPQRWEGRTVTFRAFPYDNGFAGSYRLCFEPCPPQVAERSPVVLYASANRFRGYRGDRPVVLTARYRSACPDPDAWCADELFWHFTEIAAP